MAQIDVAVTASVRLFVINDALPNVLTVSGQVATTTNSTPIEVIATGPVTITALTAVKVP